MIENRKVLLLPSRKLVVYGQRNTFTEFFTVVCCHTNDISGCLKSKSNVEVFGYVALRPICCIAIIRDPNGLKCYEESVVSFIKLVHSLPSQRMKALCPTKAAVSPLATANRTEV